MDITNIIAVLFVIVGVGMGKVYKLWEQSQKGGEE